MHSAFRLPAVAALLLALLLSGPPTRAADPQPYAVTLKATGDAALDRVLNDASSLVSLREKAPVGPFALVSRAQDDVARFPSALQGFGYYKAHPVITIAGRPLDDPGLLDALDQ